MSWTKRPEIGLDVLCETGRESGEQDPLACTGGGAHVKSADIAAYLSGPHQLVRCDEPDWRFLGLSLAGWNVPLGLSLTAASIFFAVHRGGSRYGPRRIG